VLQLLRLIAVFLFVPTLCFASVNFEEEDGTPSTYPWQVKVPNGTITENSNGGVSLNFAAAVTESDPLSLHLDQTTPQSFTAGDVAGTGLLSVSGGVLGLDSNTYLTEAEPPLGNPSQDDYVLSSKADGTRSWIAQSGGGGNPFDQDLNTDDSVQFSDITVIKNIKKTIVGDGFLEFFGTDNAKSGEISSQSGGGLSLQAPTVFELAGGNRIYYSAHGKQSDNTASHLFSVYNHIDDDTDVLFELHNSLSDKHGAYLLEGNLTVEQSIVLPNENDGLLRVTDGVVGVDENSYEPVLGNPSSDGYVLSSTADGTRTWIDMSGGGEETDPIFNEWKVLESLAIGKNAEVPEISAYKRGNFAIGEGAYVSIPNATQGAGNFAMGMNARIIHTSVQGGQYSLALGGECEVTGTAGVAIGYNAKTPGVSALSLGIITQANGNLSTAIGYGAQSNAVSSMAIGGGTRANGQYSTAVGYLSQADGNSDTAIGAECTASGAFSMAAGYRSSASGMSSVAIGNTVQATGDGSMAIGTYGASEEPYTAAFLNGANSSLRFLAINDDYVKINHKLVLYDDVREESEVVSMGDDFYSDQVDNVNGEEYDTGDIETEEREILYDVQVYPLFLVNGRWYEGSYNNNSVYDYGFTAPKDLVLTEEDDESSSYVEGDVVSYKIYSSDGNGNFSLSFVTDEIEISADEKRVLLEWSDGGNSNNISGYRIIRTLNGTDVKTYDTQNLSEYDTGVWGDENTDVSQHRSDYKLQINWNTPSGSESPTHYYVEVFKYDIDNNSERLGGILVEDVNTVYFNLEDEEKPTLSGEFRSIKDLANWELGEGWSYGAKGQTPIIYKKKTSTSSAVTYCDLPWENFINQLVVGQMYVLDFYVNKLQGGNVQVEFVGAGTSWANSTTGRHTKIFTATNAEANLRFTLAERDETEIWGVSIRTAESGDLETGGSIYAHKGYKMPNKDVVTDATEGTMAWDYENHKLVVHNGSDWQPIQYET